MAEEAKIVEAQEASAAAEQVAPVADEMTVQMIEALEGRAAFYDLLASIYFRPLTQQQIDSIAAMDLSVYADVNEFFADGLNDVTRYLRKRNTGTRQELAVDFTTSFGGTASWKGMYATPYESCFTSEEGFMMQDSYHEVFELFRRNGIQRSEGYDYPHDHLSFMCEFLVVISNRTVAALREGDRATALDNVKLSQDFLQAHILSWFDQLIERASLLQKTRFYRGILKISKGFFLFDAEVLEELREELEDAE